jgi:FkbM family methyltransferase
VRTRLHWLIWHPHQKLWNWWLAGRLRRVRLVGPLVFADSVLLLATVVVRRARHLGAGALRRAPRAHVCYVDCGTHVHGHEVAKAVEWLAAHDVTALAFEANPVHHAQAAEHLAGFPNVTVRNVALVGPDHDAADVELYVGSRDGRGDSLFAQDGRRPVRVPAVRLSTVLTDEVRGPGECVVLLRMNIEGAERFVIDDLVDAGLDGQVDGYYGMWDDLSKIDPAQDDEFRALLRSRGIHPITFNDRDLGHRMRVAAIRLDLDTSVQYGLRRKPAARA